jgi:hypothetical protein
MADAEGLNPSGPKGPCGFESRPGHTIASYVAALGDHCTSLSSCVVRVSMFWSEPPGSRDRGTGRQYLSSDISDPLLGNGLGGPDQTRVLGFAKTPCGQRGGARPRSTHIPGSYPVGGEHRCPTAVRVRELLRAGPPRAVRAVAGSIVSSAEVVGAQRAVGRRAGRRCCCAASAWRCRRARRQG